MVWPKGRKFSDAHIQKRSKSLAESRKKRKLPISGLIECSRCKIHKSRSEFYKDKRTWSGLKSQCKLCHSSCTLATRNKDLHRKRNRRSEATRRARKAKSVGQVANSDMDELESNFGGSCLRCGATKNLQWDHVVPLARGGTHSICNLQRLCRSCNEIKQARTADYRTDAQKVWVIEFKRL